MALLYNGNQVKAVYYNGNQPVKKVVYNGQTVWESSKTYKFTAQGCLIGADPNNYGRITTYDGNYPASTNGNTSLIKKCIVWYFNRDVLDFNGNTNVTLSQCMSKSISSMKFYANRNNLNAANGATYYGWVYGQDTNPYYVSTPNGNGMNVVYKKTGTVITRYLPQPSSEGVLDQGLTTQELQAIFNSQWCKQYTGSTITIGSLNTGVGYVNLQKDQYFYGIGYVYSNYNNSAPNFAPSFTFRNPANDHDAYLEIVAS